MIDLHVHSTKSDGTYTPTELVDYAIEKGLSAFALTDHDCVDGLDEAIEYADKLREEGKNVPEVIPGIEFSTEFEGHDVHIVGLYIDHKCEVFEKYLRQFVEARELRNKQMCEKFTADGIPMDYEELVAESQESAVITRAHVAQYLMKKGYVKSTKEAFDRYIGDGKPYHVPREKVLPEMAIKLVLDAGGIPVLAHPMLYPASKGKIDELVGMLKEAGLCGIEGFYSTYTPADEAFVKSLADKYHLLLSGGSDFHGANKVGIDLGVGYGKLYIHDSILEKIKKRMKNILFTDMDGTLLLSDCTVSEDMRNAMKKAVDAGHGIVLTSGRPLASIQERIVKLGLDFCNDYIISFGGALIWDCKKSQPLRSIRIRPEAITKITGLCKKYGIHVQGYSDSAIVGMVEDEELAYYRSRVNIPYVNVPDIAEYLTEGSYKLQIIHLTVHEKLEELKKEIVAIAGDEVDTFFSSPRYLEVLPKGVSKGDAVKFLSDYLSMPRSCTFTAGDEDNDISMLEAAGHGVALYNAAEKVKAAADIVTTRDNNHDGLLEIFEKYFN